MGPRPARRLGGGLPLDGRSGQRARAVLVAAGATVKEADQSRGPRTGGGGRAGLASPGHGRRLTARAGADDDSRYTAPVWRNGRRRGLKILRRVTCMWVRIPPP